MSLVDPEDGFDHGSEDHVAGSERVSDGILSGFDPSRDIGADVLAQGVFLAQQACPNDEPAPVLIEEGAREEKQYAGRGARHGAFQPFRSEEHTSELQSLMRISYAVFCLK